MAFFYVKSGGTATGNAGRYASQQSGSFTTLGAANYYPSILAALSASTPPTAGDVICVSNASAYSDATNSLSITGGTSGVGLTVMCVSDASCDQAAIATSAVETYSNNFCNIGTAANSLINVYGLYLNVRGNLNLAGGDGCCNYYRECTFEVTNSAYGIVFSSDGGKAVLVDCELKFANSNCDIDLNQGCVLEMYGGRVDGTNKLDLFDGIIFSAGGYAYLYGVDLSGITDSLLNADIDTTFRDGGLLRFARCQLNSGVEYLDSVHSLLWGQRIEVYNSAHDSTAEWQFYVREEACEAEAVSASYRDQSVAWPITGSKTSVAVDVATSGNTSISRPFSFDLPARYGEFSQAATDTLTIYLSGPSGLTDANVWVQLIAPDDVNYHVPNTVYSVADPFDPFRTGTALTADTGSSWTSGGTNNYRIEIDCSGFNDCAPIVRVYVAGASGVIYFDSQVDLS